jgi:hypothetical protein
VCRLWRVTSQISWTSFHHLHRRLSSDDHVLVRAWSLCTHKDLPTLSLLLAPFSFRLSTRAAPQWSFFSHFATLGIKWPFQLLAILIHLVLFKHIALLLGVQSSPSIWLLEHYYPLLDFLLPWKEEETKRQHRPVHSLLHLHLHQAMELAQGMFQLESVHDPTCNIVEMLTLIILF